MPVVATKVVGKCGGLLGLPGSVAGGMAGSSIHPGAGALLPEAPGTPVVAWCGAPGARGRRPSAARKGGPSAHGAPRLRGALMEKRRIRQ